MGHLGLDALLIRLLFFPAASVCIGHFQIGRTELLSDLKDLMGSDS